MSQNHEKSSYYSALTGAKRAVPIILCAIGAFVALCYFTASTGIVGGAISDVMLGLFSYGAYAIAPLLVLHGIFYPSDVAKKRVTSRLIFSAVAVLCIAVLSYAVFHVRADVKPSFTPNDYYSMGIDGKGGGVIGSVLAYGIIKVLGPVGLIIITSAVFAIYVAYFFTDGHGVIGKVCLAIISFFANVGAFIERKIKSLFAKIKEARSEKDKRISVEKSRDLSDDEFFMVDNGMKDLEISGLGIKETRSSESWDEAPPLQTKVRFKSTLDKNAPKSDSRDTHRAEDGAPPRDHKAEQPKPPRRRILHTDFDLEDTVVQPEAERADDIIYEEPTRRSASDEDSADNVFARSFDPFDLSANEKLAAKPSSRSRTVTGAQKERPKYTEDISSITPEDVERARRQADFDMKKRALLSSFSQAEKVSEEPLESNEIRTEKSTAQEFVFTGNEESTNSTPQYGNTVIVGDSADASADRTAFAPADAPVAQEKEESYAYQPTSTTKPCDVFPDDDSAAPVKNAPKSNYERLARFSGVITEYSTESKTVEEASPVVIEEYKAPDADTTASASVADSPIGNEEFISLPEDGQTLTLEREMLAKTPEDIFVNDDDEDEDEPLTRAYPSEYAAASSSSDYLSVSNNEDGGDEEDAPSVEVLSEGAEEDGDGDVEIIPEAERNPKIDEYRNMFPILDEENDKADTDDDGGLVFEHTRQVSIAPEEEPDGTDTDTDEDIPPFDMDEAVVAEKAGDDALIDGTEEEDGAPEDIPEPPKPKKPDYSNYKFPPIDILAPEDDADSEDVNAEMEENANRLIETLESFKVKASIKGVDRGPRITRYEIVPATGVKVSSIMNLQNDIALNLAAEGIRMEAPIPGKSAIGFELPNRKPSTVRLRSLLETDEFVNAKSKTMVCIGKDVAGCPVFGDIAKMPHVLIAGATGMGKSVCINSIMISILYKARPDEVKFIMIDPKKVEFTMYNGIPHLLIPVVTDPKQAAGALMWAVEQMEKRYEMIEKMRVRNIEMYNDKIAKDPSLGEPMSKIIVVIDELNDLMLQVRDPVENLIMSIAQKARAAGIHLIIGTQRPSVDVITGVIKANIPSRISCKVMSNTDSRTVLDQKGAEDLLDKGDMLFFPVGKPKPARVQGAFVSDGEVEEIMEFLKSQGGDENYDSDVMEEITRNAQKCNKKNSDDYDDDDHDGEDSIGCYNDQKFLDAVNVAVTTGKISTSLLQRKLSIGYGKAAKYVDTMEELGIVSEANKQKAREVLITKDEWHEKLARMTE